MKRLILLIGAIVSVMACVNVLTAQSSTEGVVNYEIKFNNHRRIPKEREEMKAMIPEFRIEKYQLFFKGNESLYKRVEEDSEEQMVSSPQGGGMQMRIMTPKTEIYLDATTQMQLSQQEFMGKMYLINDTLKVAPWKFGTETKVIAGYECKMAYFTDETRPDRKEEVTAWYTDKVRPFLGPDKYLSLPGTILAIDINNGERVWVAKSVELRPLKKKELQKPSEGSVVTRQQFRAMIEEQLKKNGGSGTQFIMRN